MNLERKVYETRSQKVVDFFLGIGLSIVLNVVLWFVLSLGLGVVASIVGATPNDTAQSIIGLVSMIVYGLPCLIQIALLIYFGLTRYWIALGMLGAVAFGLLITLLLVGVCFALIAGVSGGFGN